MIKVDRLALDQRGRSDQLIGGAGIQAKTAFDQAVKLAPLRIGRFAVERDHVDQERGCRQPISAVVEGAVMGMGGNNVGYELA